MERRQFTSEEARAAALKSPRKHRAQTPAFDEQLLAERLRIERARRDWSKQDLAKKSGISAYRITTLESGKAGGVIADTLYRLAQALGVSLDYLLGGSPGNGPHKRD